MNQLDIILGLGELSALLTSIFFYKKNRIEMKKIEEQLYFIINGKVLTPWEICEIMKTNFQSIKNQNFLNLKNMDLTSSFYAMVRGNIFTDKPKKSQMGLNQNVVFSKKIYEPIFSNSRRIFPKEQIIEEIHKRKFYLQTPGMNSLKQILIYFNEQLDYSKALEILQTEKFVRPKNIFTKILIKGIGVFKFILQLLRLHSMIRGYKIGEKTIEYGIPINKMLISFGKIIYDKKTQEIQMVKPELLVQQKNQLIYLKAFQLRIFLILISGYLVIKRTIKISRQLKQYFLQLYKHLKNNKLRGLNTILTEDFSCINCQEQSKSIIFQPCFHFSYCLKCYDKLKPQRCPVCKKKIKDKINIFIVQLIFYIIIKQNVNIIYFIFQQNFQPSIKINPNISWNQYFL